MGKEVVAQREDAPALTDKENATLERLMRASYSLTKPERKRLTRLLAKDRRARAANPTT